MYSLPFVRVGPLIIELWVTAEHGLKIGLFVLIAEMCCMLDYFGLLNCFERI
jgi:hypothetical protein